MSEKNEFEVLKEKLFMDPKPAVCTMGDEISLADEFCEGYKEFLDECKTERKAVKYTVDLAVANGFEEFDPHADYVAGDKVYYVNRNKSIILCVFGSKSVAEGIRLTAAHIDSPRLDLKPNPLYEDSEIAYFKTHYYGGIKKYQWPAMPLSLHGVVIKGNGEKVDVSIGEKDDEPKFVISDLLPHLAKEQMKRTLSEGIKGEELNIIIGSRRLDTEDGGNLVKLNIMKILNEKYGIVEEDFLSAELELVPAMKASDIGFDRSMIGAYGHDDRVCAYPSLMAILDTDYPEYTAICVLTDKEETGSDGNTGLNSSYLKYFIEDIARMNGFTASEVFKNVKCLSADVNAAFDPSFPSVSEKMNSSFINRGVVVTKYTGARGKSGTSDASAEFMGWVRKLFNDNNVIWQIGELGKVDEGGGGTVAMYIANLDVDVVDVGVPVLSMHSPYEVVSKIDVYMTYKAFLTFFQK